ncbi:MAG: relaxase [Flavobacterium sp. 38-13]|uniref:relaxase/mobilization nuclease domain-containing protein n=1 Tax=Flavobacterium sp. 38-13 TaxID=1896168 RepID=UPI000963569C|nr:relaxase/mobilization nuclease domain-containing protein [Flavobacterium sp. 38-13]OJX54859.1 MAG: relaxase [Flavobacterium sp. 38-13]
MVAVIKTGHSIHRIFNYNENKVAEGAASIIGAENYPLDPENLSLKMKLSLQERHLALNTNVSRNSVHISLNFAPSEEGLGKDTLREIATKYMREIGFGEQPFLVYQHFDSGHPHLHIVTNNIRRDGSRIDLHHLGIRKSEPARKAIEKEYNLVRAEDQKRQRYIAQPVSPQVVHYGKIQSKRAIQNVLDFVIGNYRYASLPELNAVLRLFNVQAERGTEDSRTFRHNGLLYRIIDSHQNPVGVPIKASSFYSTPTLQNLANRYAENDKKRQPFKQRIRNAIDLLLKDRKIPFRELSAQLQRQGIIICERRSNEGQLYGITYIDHTTKCVFNGSVLGKAYSAKGMLERCHAQTATGQDLQTKQLNPTQAEIRPLQLPQTPAFDITPKVTMHPETSIAKEALGKDIIETLMHPVHTADHVSGQFKKKKKRRKRRNKPDGNQ